MSVTKLAKPVLRLVYPRADQDQTVIVELRPPGLIGFRWERNSETLYTSAACLFYHLLGHRSGVTGICLYAQVARYDPWEVTPLTTTVRRLSDLVVFDRGNRPVAITLRPPASIGLRLHKCYDRSTRWIDVQKLVKLLHNAEPANPRLPPTS